MLCFGDIICFIEDMVEFLICIITQSIITCFLTVSLLMGTMIYLKRQYGFEQSFRIGISVMHLNTEDAGPMPTIAGANEPPVNVRTRDVPYLTYNKVPEGKVEVSFINIQIGIN